MKFIRSNSRLVAATFIAVGLLFSRLAFGQEAEPVAGAGWDTFASVYLAIGALVMAGLGWLITWGVSKLKGTYAKETAGRFLSLFHVGLKGAHAKFRIELEAARDPNSPGGVAITKEELSAIREHMWGYLKMTYGNIDAIGKVVGVFTGASVGELATKAVIDSMIDGGVAELEKSANP